MDLSYTPEETAFRAGVPNFPSRADGWRQGDAEPGEGHHLACFIALGQGATS
jgi:hypothetical protein